MLDEMMVALKRSIEGFVMPVCCIYCYCCCCGSCHVLFVFLQFIVPGSEDFVFEPQVYITVIVHTPFYTSLAQQVYIGIFV